MKIFKLILAIALLVGTGTLWALSSNAEGDVATGCALEAECESTDCSDCDSHDTEKAACNDHQ
jgi:hypothetical protein